MNALEKAAISQAAQLSDRMPVPQARQEGYVAERHALLADLIVVWAPCPCYAAFGSQFSVVTECGKVDCVFQWAEAERALLVLEQAEANLSKEGSHVGLHVLDSPVVVAAVSAPSAAGETEASGAITESEAQQAVDDLIDAMISEGGPVVPPDGTIPSPS